MQANTETPVFSPEEYAQLVTHPQLSIRKWVCERIIELADPNQFSLLEAFISDTSDELAIRAMTFLAEQLQESAAPKILARFQAAAKKIPEKSVLASWCAQALGKLNYLPALPEFILHLKHHPQDVSLLGVSAGLGDLQTPEARETLRQLLKSLETDKDRGVPYLSDVTINALLKHKQVSDIEEILRLQVLWQNSGYKNPRTLTLLGDALGPNQVFQRLDQLSKMEKIDWLATLTNEETLLGISLPDTLGSSYFYGLISTLETDQSEEIIRFSLKITQKLLEERYSPLETLKAPSDLSPAEHYQMPCPVKLSDQLALAILEGLAQPKYKIHSSKNDPDTTKKQGLLALACLVETAARPEEIKVYAPEHTLPELLALLTSNRFFLPKGLMDQLCVCSPENNAEIFPALFTCLTQNALTFGQKRAAELLGRLQYLPAIPVLCAQLVEAPNWLHASLVQALAQIGLPVLDYLEANLEQLPPILWGRLGEVLALIPYDRAAQIAFTAWNDPRIPQSDSLFMVQERIGSSYSISRLWEIYQADALLAGSSLELLCDLHEFDFPELAEVRRANQQEEEELATFQQDLWRKSSQNAQTAAAKPQADAENIEEYFSESPPKAAPKKAEKNVGRNDPCPCGSGKKFKKCCGQVLFLVK